MAGKTDEEREAVEFLRTHRCLYEGRNVRNKTVADCYRCIRASRALFGCFTADAITHLAVPQVAMINDMLEMVRNG